MIHFLDGPAEGQTLTLRRAPFFLRVVAKPDPNDPRGFTWDALDQLDDTPAADEVVYVYRRAGEVMHGFIDGAKYRGPFVSAPYVLCPVQPDDATARDNQRWREWAGSIAQQPEAWRRVP